MKAYYKILRNQLKHKDRKVQQINAVKSGSRNAKIPIFKPKYKGFKNEQDRQAFWNTYLAAIEEIYNSGEDCR
jgi:hypothetical protein